MNFVNETRNLGENFRNILYLVVSLSIGYLILVKFLAILDTGSIGLDWLANNPNNAFIFIFVLWLFLILAVDLIIDLVSNYSKRRKAAYPAAADSRQKTVSIQAPQKKPTPTKELKGEDSITKKAQTPASKKTKWSIFWRKRDKIPPSRIQGGKQTAKGEIMPQKVEIKTEAPKKEGEPAVKPLKPEGKETKSRAERTKVAEEPKQEIREPAANIQSTDTTAISVKKDKRLIEAFDEEHHVSVIELTPNISRKKTMIKIEKLKAASHLAEEIPPNIIFENFNIRVNIPEKSIANPVIVFKVDQGWAAENNLKKIKLYKYVSGEWVLQGPIEKLDSDEEHFYFGAQVRGLSGSYAIVGDISVSESRQKNVGIQAHEEKPIPIEVSLDSLIKEARAPGFKKIKWPIFWRKQDKTTPPISPEKKRGAKIVPKKEGPKNKTPKKEALREPETRPLELRGKEAKKAAETRMKGEIIPKKEEPKTEAPGETETKPLEQAKKNPRGKTAKDKAAKTTAIDSRQKTASIQAPEIKEAQISGSKKKIWPIFWRKQDKTTPSPEEKKIVKTEIIPKKEEPKAEALKKEASGKPEAKPLERGKAAKDKAAKTRIKREIMPRKGGPKAEALKKEAHGEPGTKPSKPGGKRQKTRPQGPGLLRNPRKKFDNLQPISVNRHNSNKGKEGQTVN